MLWRLFHSIHKIAAYILWQYCQRALVYFLVLYYFNNPTVLTCINNFYTLLPTVIQNWGPWQKISTVVSTEQKEILIGKCARTMTIRDFTQQCCQYPHYPSKIPDFIRALFQIYVLSPFHARVSKLQKNLKCFYRE